MVFLHYIFVSLFLSTVLSDNQVRVHYLVPGNKFEHAAENSNRFFGSSLWIYCYRGNEKTLGRIFNTVQLKLDIETVDFNEYEGPNPETVQEHYDSQKSIFSFNFLPSKKKNIQLDPFNQTCIGIETPEWYRVNLDLIRIDFYRIIIATIGLFVFWFSSRLSENSLFYYLSGILLGIFASFMVLIYITSKLIPKKSLMYGALIGGWTLAIYFTQLLWENIQVIIFTYQAYVFWYVVLTGFISFIICYRLGTPENQRSRNIVKWLLQFGSLILIYLSSHFQEATAAVDILLLIIYYFPWGWLNQLKYAYIKKYPPKRKLLTNEEYYEEGVRETTKALNDLRGYCSSPECKQWRVITKLKDPIRFANFIEGTSHINDEEILNYETSKHDTTDSELSEDESQTNSENEANQRISALRHTNNGKVRLTKRYSNIPTRSSSRHRESYAN